MLRRRRLAVPGYEIVNKLRFSINSMRPSKRQVGHLSQRVMYKKEYLLIASAALVVFFAIAGAGWLVGKRIQSDSTKIVLDTFSGLMDSGAAINRYHDNQLVLILMLKPHTPAELGRMISQVETNHAEPLWLSYARGLDSQKEREDYEAMEQARGEYLQARKQFFNLLLAGETQKATTLFEGDLSRRFQRYDNVASTLFQEKTLIGMESSDQILRIIRYEPVCIASLGLLLFLAGLIIGLRAALSGTKDSPMKNLRSLITFRAQ